MSTRVTTVRPDTVVVRVEGELDHRSADLLEAILLPMSGNGVRHLIVAADRLRFCDVRGFRVLANVHVIMNALDGRLAVAAPTPALRRLIQLMRQIPMLALDPPIRMYATVAEAVDSELGRSVSSTVNDLR